jgi:hypothetical protein
LIGLPFFDSPKNFSSRLCSLVILMFFWPPSIQFSPSYINIFCGKGSAQVINRFTLHLGSWRNFARICNEIQEQLFPMLGQMKWKVQLNILHPKRLSRRSFHCHNSKFSIILTYFIVLQSASCTWCRRKLLKSFSILFSYLLCAMICTYASHKLYRLNLIWYNCSTLHPSFFILKNLNFIDAYLGLQFYCLIAEFSVIMWSTLLNTPVLEHIQPSSHDHKGTAAPVDKKTAYISCSSCLWFATIIPHRRLEYEFLVIMYVY